MSTKNYVIADSTGLVVGSAIVPDADIQLQQAPEGCTLHIGIHARPFMDRIVDGEVVPVTPPGPTLAERKAALLAELAERRWHVEAGGITLESGARIETDDRAKLLITGARAAAMADANFSTRWKCADGEWATLTADQVLAVYTAVFGHVAECFSREAEIAEQVVAANAETIDRVAALIPPFWQDPA